MKNKPIFSRTIAELLQEEGFKLIETRINYRDHSKCVYFFEDTPELYDAFCRIVGNLPK